MNLLKKLKHTFGLLFKHYRFVLNYQITNRNIQPFMNFSKMKYEIPYKVKIPTYDRSGQAVHPSVLYDKKQKLLLLAFTPYTNTNDKVENPSIVISKDGFHFYEEKKHLNPIVPAPRIDHNDDPDLFFYNNKYNILYLETLRPECQNLILLESNDRIHWCKSVLQTEIYDKKNVFMLSPCFLDLGDKVRIYYVNLHYHEKPHIEYVEGTEVSTIMYTSIYSPIIDLGNEIPWHIDIKRGPDEFYYMLICCVKQIDSRNFYYLKIAKSKDGKFWKLSKKVIFNNCYRSTMLFNGNDIIIYLSRIYYRNKWKLSIIKFSIADIFE